ncbi:unnamed protein product, partial [Tilletia caries]
QHDDQQQRQHHLNIWSYETGALVKTFDVSKVPVRCVKFIARNKWFVAGSDDFFFRCSNYNTHEKVTAFEAHPDYIRSMAVHPTASLLLTGSDDMTIKLWAWDKNWRHVQGHPHSIMNLAFNPKDSNTFASSCLDRTVKVWSLGSSQANYTLETLKGHTSNVSYAVFHTSLPLIISGSEDGTIKLWHSNTYRLENTLDYGLERAWSIAYKKTGNDLALGFDEGAVVIKIGKEEPSVSMDSGKLVWAKNAEVLGTNLGGLVPAELPADGQRINVGVREIGGSEVYATNLVHSPNGCFVAVVGDGEYIIYTALVWRNKAFGPGFGFAWASDSNTYVVKESDSKIKVFKNFKERPNLIPIGYKIVDVKGGNLLGVIALDAGEARRSRTRVAAVVLISPASRPQTHRARTARWTGECFMYTTASNRLQYLIGEQTNTVHHSDRELYLLGYLPQHGRIYMADQDMGIYSFTLSLSVVEYQTAILRGDLEAASTMLESVPLDQRNKLARFLETQDHKELALQVTQDPDHKFDLAVSLDDFDTALEIAQTGPQTGSEPRWRTIGDKAIGRWNLSLAQECFEKAKDLNALLLLGISAGDRTLLSRVATQSSTSPIPIRRVLFCNEALCSCSESAFNLHHVDKHTMMNGTYIYYFWLQCSRWPRFKTTSQIHEHQNSAAQHYIAVNTVLTEERDG